MFLARLSRLLSKIIPPTKPHFGGRARFGKIPPDQSVQHGIKKTLAPPGNRSPSKRETQGGIG